MSARTRARARVSRPDARLRTRPAGGSRGPGSGGGAASTRSRSRSARTMATESGAWATIVPHGSMTIERPNAGWPGGPPICDGARTYARVLDRPRPEQDLPVVATGALGEVGRDGQDRRAGQRERAIELGEAQVVADRQADGRRRRPWRVTSRSPAVTRADSVSTGPASTATSNRWTLR